MAPIPTAKLATIFGGSGFLGSYAATALAEAGYRVQIVSRNPEKAAWVKTAAQPGQIVVRQGNVRDMASIEACVKGSDLVVNAVGILAESGRQGFQAIHAQAAERIAQAAASAGVRQLVHVSALGVDKAKNSRYARSKLNGEKAVQAAFPAAVILRPSVLFGAEDNFFNLFAKLATVSPALPLIGGGRTRFQPVYVGDVAKAVVVAAHGGARGRIFELGGPKTYSMREIYTFILNTIGKKRLLVSVPFPFAMLGAAFVQWVPGAPLTVDQVKLLQHDNVVEPGQPSLRDLGITARSVESIVPAYLTRFRKKLV